MKISPNTDVGSIEIGSLSLNEIDNMIEALQKVRAKASDMITHYEKAIEEHGRAEGNAVGVMGFYSSDEPKVGSENIEYLNEWTHKHSILKFTTKPVDFLYSDMLGRAKGLVYPDGGIFVGEKDPTKMPDTLPDQRIQNGEIVTIGERTNILKAQMLIEEADANPHMDICRYIRFPTHYPCGGVFAAKVMSSYFICEHNIKGISIKEVSEAFYNAFVDEFSGE
jgi:hypothetical protein